MTSQHPSTYYEAKRRIVEHDFRGYDGSAVPSHASEIVEALGWTAPEPAQILGAPGKKGKVVKVFLTRIPSVLGEDLTKRAGGQRWSASYSGAAAYVVAETKKEASSLFSLGYSWAAPKTGDVHEVAPSDYRYCLAVDNPGFLVLTEGGEEFGEPIFVPTVTPEKEN